MATALDHLRSRAQWVNWKYLPAEDGKGKPRKIPVNPRTGGNAASNNPATWGTYDEALAWASAYVDPFDWSAYCDGKYADEIAHAKQWPLIGFMLADDDDITVGDLDNVWKDGRLEAWAQEIVILAETYCEMSPSGNGLHFWWLGKIPHAVKLDAAQVEMYGNKRYLTWTGQKLNHSPDEIRPAPQTLTALISRVEQFKAANGRGRAGEGGKKSRAKSGSDDKRSSDERVPDGPAMKNLGAWVPVLFPQAKQSGTGWRVSSASLGRQNEEDISITPEGIKDFGVHDTGDKREGRRTPTELVMEHLKCDVEHAVAWLCAKLGIEMSDVVVLDYNDPRRSARKLIDHEFTDDNERTLLRRHREQFWHYDGSYYRNMSDEVLDAAIWEFLDHAKRRNDKGTLIRFNPDSAKVSNIRNAAQSIVMLDEHMDVPSWLDGGDHPPPEEFFACSNGLLHVPTRELYPATPDFFGLAASEVVYDPDAPEPKRWLQYLDEAIGDRESIDTLGEWMGYTLTPDTSQQKILLGVGQSRSGKGTYGRVHRSLLGRDSIAAPTLASLGEQFGKNALIGKPLAIISDARIGAKTNKEGLIESLLSISGEDAVSVQRKFLSDWIGKLPTRIAILTNELPALLDSSGAFAIRLIIVHFPNTFLGREDHMLSATLDGELSGILNFAIEGYARLRERGYFKQPAKSEALRDSVETLGSPVKAFVRDRCKLGHPGEVATGVLYAAWKRWCEEGGGGGMSPGSKEWFTRNLYSAFPGVTQARRGPTEKRTYVMMGLSLAQEDETGIPF